MTRTTFRKRIWRTWLAAFGAVGIALAIPRLAICADPEEKPGENKLSCSGKIEQVEQSSLRLKTDDKHAWVVHVPSSATVQVTGTTTYEYLRPGTVVKFTQAIDDKGILKDWFKEIEIIETHVKPPLGVFAPGAAEHDRPEKKVGAGEFLFRGKVKTVKETPDGKILTVVAGTKTVQGYFDDKTEFNVTSEELSLASPGDEIKVLGTISSPENAHYNPPQPGQAIAETVKISLVETIQVEGKKGSKATPAAKTKPKAKVAM
jgi:hypothetical protein